MNLMRNKKALNLLMILCATVFAVSAFGLWRELSLRSQGRSFYTAVLSGVATRSSAQNPSLGAAESEAETPWVPYMDFDALREIIPGVKAWIAVDGTVIYYPVMQGTDNDHFLHHLPDGARNQMGSIFLDYRNSPDFTDRNSVIYGHHMRSGDMFGQLDFYREQDFYDQHPIFMLYTPERDYHVEIFAGYIADASRETIPIVFSDTSDFEAYVDEVRRRSIFESTVDVNESDRLVTLVTCTTNVATARFVLVGRIIGEEEES